MLAALVTFTFAPDDAAAPLDPGTETAGRKDVLPGLLSRIDWRDTANHRSGSIYVWASREPAVLYYDEAFMERCERTVGIRPSVEFLEVTALHNDARGDS